MLKLADAPADSFTVMMKVPSTACLKKFADDMGSDGPANPLATFDVPSAHNVECKFYEFLREAKCLPIAKTWYTQQATVDQVGVILMEDLAEDGINLGCVSALTVQQVRLGLSQKSRFSEFLKIIYKCLTFCAVTLFYIRPAN